MSPWGFERSDPASLRVLPISDISWSIAASSLGLSCGTLGGVPDAAAGPAPELLEAPAAEPAVPAEPVDPAVDPFAAPGSCPAPAAEADPAVERDGLAEVDELCADVVVCAGDEDDAGDGSPPPDVPEDGPPLAAGTEVVVPVEPEAGVRSDTRPPHAASPAPRATAKTTPVASDFAWTSLTAPPICFARHDGRLEAHRAGYLSVSRERDVKVS